MTDINPVQLEFGSGSNTGKDRKGLHACYKVHSNFQVSGLSQAGIGRIDGF
jgi:hypothetical protein